MFIIIDILYIIDANILMMINGTFLHFDINDKLAWADKDNHDKTILLFNLNTTRPKAFTHNYAGFLILVLLTIVEQSQVIALKCCINVFV